MKIKLVDLRHIIREEISRLNEDTCPCGIERSDCEYHANSPSQSRGNICVFEFDVVDLASARRELRGILHSTKQAGGSLYDMKVKRASNGYDEISIRCDDPKVCERVRDWCILRHVSWSDEQGEVHDDHC